MREVIEHRLQLLATEYNAGHEMLAELDGRRANLQATLARISGAIQVLQELLQDDQPPRQETKPESAAKTLVAA